MYCCFLCLGQVLNVFIICVCLRVCVCYSRDSDLSTIISNLHHTRQHGMPEGQSASERSTSTGHTGRTVSEMCVRAV